MYNHDMSSTSKSAVLDRPKQAGQQDNDLAALRWFADLKVSDEVADRMDELAYKNTEGQITDEEREEYHLYVEACDRLTLAKVRARNLLAARQLGK